jgi:ribosomal protein S18 acetylase RimI-like enzyme
VTPPPDLVIRDAAPDDEEQISTVTRRAYAEYVTTMEPAAWAGLREMVTRTLLSDNPAQKIVAVLEGRVVGSVMLSPAAAETYGGAIAGLPWPEVRLLAVEPDARGRGIARALMEECLRRAAAAGAGRIGIHTSRSMRAALGMYRAMGFERAPDFDFRPDGGELVEAYVLELPRER